MSLADLANPGGVEPGVLSHHFTPANIAFTQGDFYYGNPRDTIWNNEMNHREMLKKEQKHLDSYIERNVKKEREDLRKEDEKKYQQMRETVGMNKVVPGFDTWRGMKAPRSEATVRTLTPTLTNMCYARPAHAAHCPWQRHTDMDVDNFLKGVQNDRKLARWRVHRTSLKSTALCDLG